MEENLDLHLIYTDEIFVLAEDKAEMQKVQDLPSATTTEKQEVETELIPKIQESVDSKEEPTVGVVSEPLKKADKIDKLYVLSPPLTPDTEEMLNKLLTALGIAGDAYLVSQESNNLTDYKRVLIFGNVSNKKFYSPVQHDGTEAMRSPTLAHLQNDVAGKRQLWEALKGWLGKR